MKRRKMRRRMRDNSVVLEASPRTIRNVMDELMGRCHFKLDFDINSGREIVTLKGRRK